MKDWKDLQIDNLPPDILTGEYEFATKECEAGSDYEFYAGCPFIIRTEILRQSAHEGRRYCYRKIEPAPPSHEEIMTLWWEIGGKIWVRIINYDGGSSNCYCYLHNNKFFYPQSSFFINRRSATIPPEA